MLQKDRKETAKARITAARGAMARQGFDALLLINSTNMMFLSGYPSNEITLARPFYLLVPLKGEPVLLVHEGRRAEAMLYSWISDVRTYKPLSVAPLPQLNQAVHDLGLSGKRIGCELGYEQRLGLPFREFERVRQEVLPCILDDAADLLWELRQVKSEGDIVALRKACAITSKAYSNTFQSLRAGMRDSDVAVQMQMQHLQLGGGSPWVVLTSGRGNYDLATGAGSGRELLSGDMVWMDGGCAISGFWSDFSRAAVIGHPSTEQLHAQRLIHEITQEGVEMARPGVRVCDIALHCNARLARLELTTTSSISGLAGRIGHGIGLDLTEPPHVAEYDSTVLRPGMVISIEPGIATEYGIFHAEEDVLVTPSGPEVLSVAPWELHEVPA